MPEETTPKLDAAAVEQAWFAMEEFKALKAELVQRNTILMQMIVACMTAIVVLIGFIADGKRLEWWVGVALILFVLAVLGGAWKMIDSDARNACKRLIEIEAFVGKATKGEENMPLSWERRFGLLSRNYVDRLKKFNYDAR